MDQKSPDAFRTISEVAEWLETPAHVLRFWESKFSQVKPVKRAGGRRYYRPSDMTLLGGIKKLLHDDGLTIRGVQKILRSEGVKHVSALSPSLDESPAEKKAPEESVDTDTSKVMFRHSETAPEEHDDTSDSLNTDHVAETAPPPEPSENDMQTQFLFEADTPTNDALPSFDISSIAEPRADDDACFDAPLGAFPLRDQAATRMQLSQNAAKIAALYERLVALSDQMPAPRP